MIDFRTKSPIDVEIDPDRPGIVRLSMPGAATSTSVNMLQAPWREAFAEVSGPHGESVDVELALQGTKLTAQAPCEVRFRDEEGREVPALDTTVWGNPR